MINMYIQPRDSVAQPSTVLDHENAIPSLVPQQLEANIRDKLEKCSDNLKSLVVTLDQEITDLNCDQNRIWGLIMLACPLFRVPSLAFKLVVRKDRIEDLITQTKKVETSLGHALTALLCCRYKTL